MEEDFDRKYGRIYKVSGPRKPRLTISRRRREDEWISDV